MLTLPFYLIHKILHTFLNSSPSAPENPHNPQSPALSHRPVQSIKTSHFHNFPNVPSSSQRVSKVERIGLRRAAQPGVSGKLLYPAPVVQPHPSRYAVRDDFLVEIESVGTAWILEGNLIGGLS